MKNTLPTLALSLSFLGQSLSRAALLTYDGFPYPAGSFAGQNGGMGWNDGRMDANGKSVAQANDIYDTASVANITITINPTGPKVFCRLYYPMP